MNAVLAWHILSFISEVHFTTGVITAYLFLGCSVYLMHIAFRWDLNVIFYSSFFCLLHLFLMDAQDLITLVTVRNLEPRFCIPPNATTRRRYHQQPFCFSGITWKIPIKHHRVIIERETTHFSVTSQGMVVA